MTNFTKGAAHAGHGAVMTVQPIPPQTSGLSSSGWWATDNRSATCNRSYWLALVRTGLIAVVLLVVLVLLAWF